MVEKRKLGRFGLEIAPLVFGSNVFGWTADQAPALIARMESGGQQNFPITNHVLLAFLGEGNA